MAMAADTSTQQSVAFRKAHPVLVVELFHFAEPEV